MALAGLIVLLLGCYRAGREELQRAVDPLNGGHYSEAIARLQALKERYPEDARIDYYLGFAYLKEENYSSALQRFHTALKLSPNYKQVIGDVGLANFLAGNSENIQEPLFKVAVRELQRIIREYRGKETADEIRYHLGHLFLMKKEYLKALGALQEVIAEPPASPLDIRAQLAMGDIYLNLLDRPEKGLGIYQTIVHRYVGREEAAGALYALALYHQRKGEMYRQRYLALEKFYQQWEGVRELEKDRKEAKSQAREDLSKAQALQETAAIELKQLIDHYPQSFYHSKAKGLLVDMEKSRE